MKKARLSFARWLVLPVIGLFLAMPLAQAQYCVAGGPIYTGDSNVTNVTLNGETSNITHIGCPGVLGVENLTHKFADLIPGETYTVSVTWGTCGGVYSGAGTVWIDFNGNQTFDQAEVIGTWVGSPTVSQDYTFTVPADAVNGNTRMRVMQRESGSLPLDPCASFSWGSVMDFGIQIGAGGPSGPIQVVIGNGTASSSFPYNTFWHDARTQILITPDEMMLAGGAPGEITKLGFNVITPNASQQPMFGFRISGQTTSLTTISGFVETGWTELWFGTYTVLSAGWQEHVFNVPLFWDGQSSILFEICFDNTSYTSATTVYATSAPGRTWARNTDGDVGCILTGGAAQANRPNLGMEIEPLAPAEIQGIVLNANTMQPVTGAVVNVGGAIATTLANGQFSLEVWSGPNTISVTKPGFAPYSEDVFLDPGDVYQIQVELLESTNPPGAVFAALNTPQTAVNLNWGLPTGPYEIVYDDGTFENMTSWSQAGSINAVRFTPIAHPVNILSGSIHIGDGTYPPAQTIPNTFEVAIFAQDGSPFGWPGEELARFEVNRGGNFGWITFDLPSPVTITSGDFYIAMVQVGNYPNTIGIAIDETAPLANRSYAKFVSGPWSIAGYQDFMIRAIVSGPGGPWGGGLLAGTPEYIEPTRHHREAISLNPSRTTGGLVGEATYIPVETGMPAPEDLLGYNVFRFEQGDEGDEGAWTALGTPSNNAFVDNGWNALPDGAYRWAVKARYTGDRMSPPTFSNVLGKGFTVDAVTFNLSLSSGATPSGIEVVMVNQLVPDSTYASLSGEDGVVVYNNVWKGTYDITVYKFGFELWTTTETLTANKTYNLMLWQLKNPPTGLYVDDRSLLATWNRPVMQALIFEETFSSGNFTFNDWTVDGTNWFVTFFGNPSPSAQFDWSPTLTNYSQAITSKLLTGVGSPEVFLYFDIYLSNFSQTTIEKMAAEVWDGADWIPVKTFDNSVGSIPWTSNTVDITEYVSGDFRVRFRAYGDDTYQINNWNIDNVRVLGVETDFSVMGYNFYLNDLQTGFVTETEYQIPPSLITYGQTYLAEVAAVYQSGVSQRIGYTFTSYFLPAPRNLAGLNVENAVQLTWLEPVVPGIESEALNAPAAADYPKGLYPPSTGMPPADGVPTVVSDAPQINLSDFFRGTMAFGVDASTGQVVSFDTDAPQVLTNLGPYGGSGFSNAGDFPVNETSFMYELENNGSFKKITFEPFNVQVLGTIPGDWTGMATNPLTGTMYAITTTQLYTIDPVALTSTLVGPSGSGMNIALAIDGNGDGWTYDLVDDMFYHVDLSTGARTLVGSIGFDANFGQGMTWDSQNDRILMSAFNNGSFQAELREVNRATGASVLIGAIGTPGSTQLGWMAIPIQMGAAPAEGLIGYNIYRGGSLHDFVEVPELEFWDLNLLPGNYKYSATAVYDLTVFGLTGTDESLHSNEIEIGVNNFGYPLPFVEEWTSANFSFNNWAVTDNDPHWRVTTAQGNPVPAAEFTWSPPVKEYWYAITSPALNAAPFTCADIFLEFDIKLNDRNATEDEKLIVQHFVNGSWIPLKEFKNSGSFNWTHESIQMPLATGKTFHIRFVATGKNTADILSWFVDNIHVYAACRAPMDLMGNQIGNEEKAYLEWVEPDCESGPSGQLVKLSQWDGGPDNGYFQSFNMAYGVVYDLASYPDATLELVDFHHASWGTLGTWDYKIHVVNWNTYQVIETFGPFQTTGNDKWENGIQIGQLMGYGGGLVGIMLEPLGNSPTDAYPCFSADNTGPNGVSLFGNIPNWSAFAVSGIGDFLQNLWIRTNFSKDGGLVKLAPVTAGELAAKTRMPVNKSEAGELVQTSKLIPSFDNATKDSPVEGYNVYRSDDLGATFNLITPAPVTTLNYTDLDVVYGGEYHYYVTALFDVCESVASNDVVVTIIVGVDELDTDAVSIYPIPATTQLNINVTNDIRSMRIMNYMGQIVFEQATVKDQLITVNTTNFAPGAYMVQLVNEAGQTITRRVVITK